MQVQQKLLYFTIFASLIGIVLPFVNSFQEPVANKTSFSHASSKNSSTLKKKKQLSPKLQLEVAIHGFILWASMGFLMPVGILIIRMQHRQECGRRAQILFYLHSASQMLSVLLSTTGEVMSVKNFNNSFNNHHQRIGVGLYGMVWLQAFIGFFRPHRGCKGRRLWFLVHWILGTAVSLLGIINVYTGLQAYHEKASKGIQVWNIIFTIEVSFIVFLYLLQDKWVYVQKQGVCLGNELERSSAGDIQVIPPTPKKSTAESCSGINSLKNL